MTMKKTLTLIIIGVALIGLVAFALTRRQGRASQTQHAEHPAEHPATASDAKAIPAHYETEPARDTLAPTLDPEKFKSTTRDAYRIVRESPQLIAQLPCYCYCDRGFGHKSLHSCYVDDHAAHCAVCVDEVLKAYEMQKRGLSPQQIREQIVAEYGG